MFASLQAKVRTTKQLMEYDDDDDNEEEDWSARAKETAEDGEVKGADEESDEDDYLGLNW